MTTLQDLRVRRFRTIKAFAEAYGCGASKASGILRGLYHMTLSKDEVRRLASVLGVDFVTCADACDATFAEVKHYRKDGWQRTPRTHKGIWERWRWEEALLRDTRWAAERGDWTDYRKKYVDQQDQQRRQQAAPRQTFVPDCYSLLGIGPGATRDQIINSRRKTLGFRRRDIRGVPF